MAITLWPAQQMVFDFAVNKKAAALLCQQRTGKTFITLKLIEHRINELEGSDEFVGLLVCLLNNKESTWVDGLAKYVPQLQVFTNWDEFKKAKGHRLLVLHFESLAGLISKLVKYKKFNWACVDEAHRLYNAGSKQSRAMARLSWIEWKIILTGTPMEKRPSDFFGQFKFLDPSVFGTNKGDFEEEWLDWKKIDIDYRHGPRPGSPAYRQKMMQQRILKGKAKFKEERLPEFVELLKPYCIRIEKSDVGILPPKVIVHRMEYGAAHVGRYERMKKESVLEFRDVEVLAQMPATRVMKLRQLAAGFIYDEDGELHWLSSRKIHETIELFESLPKPVVIFAAFVPEVLRIHRMIEALGYDAALVYGGTPKKKRPGVWRAFQAAQLDAVVCQIGAGGVGVDLWKANHAIVTSMAYSSIIWDQAKARMDSRDKRIPAEIHLLMADKTIDEDLFDLIEIKGETTKSVLRQLKGKYSWPRKKLHPSRPSARCPNTTPRPSPKIWANRPPKSASCSVGQASRNRAPSGAGTRKPNMTRSSKS